MVIDVSGFLTRVVEPATNGQDNPVWDFQNDALGRVTAESLQGQVLQRTVYDVRDRVTSVSLLEPGGNPRVPAERTISTVYNAFDQVVSSTDPLGQTSTNVYDQFQRYVSTTRPDGSVVGRTYNLQGEVASHFNGNNASTGYFYDNLHRLVRMVHPTGGGEENFEYDSKGRLVHWKKIDGTDVLYQYNALNQVFRVTHQNQQKLAFTFDLLNRVTTRTDEVGTSSYSPESDLTQTTNVHGRTIRYEYDANHQLIGRSDPEGLTTQFSRDARGQVSRVAYDGLSCDYTYNSHGDMTQANWNTGLLERYGYSSQGELMDSQLSFAGRGNLEVESDTRDGLGRKATAVFNLPNGVRTHNYIYDRLGQLTSSSRLLQASGGGTTTRAYAYDRNFNRTRNDNQSSGYSQADRYSNISGLPTPSYNAAGAISTDQLGATFGYDWRDQMTAYNRGTTHAQYRYDGDNLRVEKTVNGATTRYLYDGSQVLKEYNGDGSVKASYFLGMGRGAIKTGGRWYNYLTDSHGSVTGLLDNTGNRVSTYEYSDYGETLSDQGTVYNPYRWNGEQLDAESGLVYLRNRYYQPSTGRFMQRDPIGYEGGLNLYAYCGGDPIQGSDPSGLQPPGLVTDPMGVSHPELGRPGFKDASFYGKFALGTAAVAGGFYTAGRIAVWSTRFATARNAVGAGAGLKILAGEHGQEIQETLEGLVMPPGHPQTVTIRGIHVVNKGKVKGSAEVVRSIEATGIRTDTGMFGHAAYAHAAEREAEFIGQPYILFEATVRQDQLEVFEKAAGGAYFRIRNNEENLPITILKSHGLDE